MRRINLLPSEDRRRGVAIPAVTGSGLLGVLLILGALLLLVMIGLYLYYYIRLGNEEEQITQIDQDIAREQARIQELAPFRDLQARLDAKKPIADGIFRTRFPWDEFLRGLSFVIPESTALDVFAGQATPINIEAPAGGAPEVQNLEPPGTITFNGFAAPEDDNADDEPKYQYVSDFIVRMNNLRFLTNADLTSAELDRQNFPQPGAIAFQVGAELVTRIGENGDEVLLGTEEDGGEEGREEEEGNDEGAEPPGTRPSRAEVGR
jgi:type IV pilus assembly protein PilN